MKHARIEETKQSKGTVIVFSTAVVLAAVALIFTNIASAQNAPLPIYVVIALSIALVGTLMTLVEDFLEYPWARALGICGKVYTFAAASYALLFAVGDYVKASAG